jgi:hypothetical protein
MLIKIISLSNMHIVELPLIFMAELCKEAIQGKKEGLKVRHLEMY